MGIGAAESSSRLMNRRALEALRNGVPNGDAVAVLGCNQPAVEREFNSMLARVCGESDIADSGLGMLVAGEFGAGKSHLAELPGDPGSTAELRLQPSGHQQGNATVRHGKGFQSRRSQR